MKRKIFLFGLIFWLFLAGPAQPNDELNIVDRAKCLIHKGEWCCQQLQEQNKDLFLTLYLVQLIMGKGSQFYMQAEDLKVLLRESFKLADESKKLLAEAKKATVAQDKKQIKEKVEQFSKKLVEADRNNKEITNKLTEIVNAIINEGLTIFI